MDEKQTEIDDVSILKAKIAKLELCILCYHCHRHQTQTCKGWIVDAKDETGKTWYNCKQYLKGKGA